MLSMQLPAAPLFPPYSRAIVGTMLFFNFRDTRGPFFYRLNQKLLQQRINNLAPSPIFSSDTVEEECAMPVSSDS